MFGTPVRRTRRRKSQKMDFHEFWDSCAQNKTSEISKSALSGILGLLCAGQDVGNLNKMHFQEFWDSCAQNKTSKISKNAFQGILGLLCAEQTVGNLKHALSGILRLLYVEQDIGNLKTCTFRNSGAPVRKTKRRKSQNLHFQKFWDSCARNNTSEMLTDESKL